MKYKAALKDVLELRHFSQPKKCCFRDHCMESSLKIRLLKPHLFSYSPHCDLYQFPIQIQGGTKLLLKSKAKAIPTLCEGLYLCLIHVTITKILPPSHKTHTFLITAHSNQQAAVWDLRGLR